MQRMQLWSKGLNPLSFAFWGSVIALPFWLAYLRESHWLAVVVIVADSVFVVLYLRHSCFAWHSAFVANIGFAIYHFAAGRHLTLDITIATALIIYLLLVRSLTLITFEPMPPTHLTNHWSQWLSGVARRCRASLVYFQLERSLARRAVTQLRLR